MSSRLAALCLQQIALLRDLQLSVATTAAEREWCEKEIEEFKARLQEAWAG